MRGQSSVEMLVLVAGIMVSVGSLLYLGTVSNESTVVLQAARDGAENAIFAIDMSFGCTIAIDNVAYDGENISISVTAWNAPPENIEWENFRENVIENVIRDVALKHMHNAIGGILPSTATPVVTNYNTYDVAVEARRLIK